MQKRGAESRSPRRGDGEEVGGEGPSPRRRMAEEPAPPTLCPDKADKARDAGGGATGLGGKAASGAVMASWGQSEGKETSLRHRRDRREKERKGCVTLPNGEGGKVNSDENDAAAEQNGRRRSPPYKTRTFPSDCASSTTRARPREGTNGEGGARATSNSAQDDLGRHETGRASQGQPERGPLPPERAAVLDRAERPPPRAMAPPPTGGRRDRWRRQGDRGDTCTGTTNSPSRRENPIGTKSAETPTTKRKRGATHPGRRAGLEAARHTRPRRRRRAEEAG